MKQSLSETESIRGKDLKAAKSRTDFLHLKSFWLSTGLGLEEGKLKQEGRSEFYFRQILISSSDQEVKESAKILLWAVQTRTRKVYQNK